MAQTIEQPTPEYNIPIGGSTTGDVNLPGVSGAGAAVPDIMPPAVQKAEKAAMKGTAATGQPYAEVFRKLLATTPTAPTMQSDINQLLKPYVDELTNLGPEYATEMSYLAPYLSPEFNFSGVTAAANARAGGGVAAFNPATAGEPGLEAAEMALGQAAQKSQPGFSRLDQPVLNYENSLRFQAPIEAALGFQKYLQTYQGYAPSTAGWPDALAKAMGSLGSGAQTNLPSITQSIAAAGGPASTTYNPQPTNPSNPASGGALGGSSGG